MNIAYEDPHLIETLFDLDESEGYQKSKGNRNRNHLIFLFYPGSPINPTSNIKLEENHKYVKQGPH